MPTIEELTSFCKKKGFVYQSGELYNGIAGFWDFGPLGVELKERIKRSWWKRFVQTRENVLGIDGAIITHPKIWQASGHVNEFTDLMVHCKKCKGSNRIDQLTDKEPSSLKEAQSLLAQHPVSCPTCKTRLEDVQQFNLMFTTYIGPHAANTAYLRPETAQLIFANFKNITNTQRVKLPFGIAQMGKAYRNEISPRDFLFRSREFEQMELEFFTHPDKQNDCPAFAAVQDKQVPVLFANGKTKTVSFADLAKTISAWHAYWLYETWQWFLDLGISEKNLRLREHSKKELAHYASACYDIEYNFPFGWKEIHGNANRGNYDLTQHQTASGKDLHLFDDETKQKVLPVVVSEPSQGVDRAFLAILFDAYHDDKERKNTVLKLHPHLAPIQVGVFPLVNKLKQQARDVYELLKHDFTCTYDSSGSIGKRYARADEQGIPYCITMDFDGLEDSTVTIRTRDTTEQRRVTIANLHEELRPLLF